MFLNTLAVADRAMGTVIDKSMNGYTEKDNKRKQEVELTLKPYYKRLKTISKNSSDGISLYARKKVNVNFQHSI